jgi:hypothetical protein
MSRKSRRTEAAAEEDSLEDQEEVQEEFTTEIVDSEGNAMNSARKGNRIVVFAKTHQTKFWWVLGCALLVILIVIPIYWVAFDRSQVENHHHWRDLESRMSARELGRDSLSVGQSALYSLASVLGAGRRAITLALCHRASYDAVQRDGREWLVPSDMSARAQALAQRQIGALPKNFLLDTRLEMRYNVEVAPDVLVKNGLSPTQRYQTLHYEVASNYARFSSVKLLVSSEDLYRQAPRVRQEVVICSNRPDSERRCDLRGDKLLMNNTLLFPMEGAVQVTDAPPSAETPTGVRQSQTEEPQRGVDLVEQDKENLRGLEYALANNRQFHVLFYRETAASARTTGRDDAADYSEYIALTVEPAMC